MIEVSPNSGRWQIRKEPIPKGKARLTILDFFDWEGLNYWELRYFKVRIEELQGEPDLAGRTCLIETTSADVLWEPPGIVGLPSNLKDPG